MTSPSVPATGDPSLGDMFDAAGQPTRAAADRLALNGYAVIPITDPTGPTHYQNAEGRSVPLSPGKRPALTNWQKCDTTHALAHFTDGCNLGLRMGGASFDPAGIHSWIGLDVDFGRGYEAEGAAVRGLLKIGGEDQFIRVGNARKFLALRRVPIADCASRDFKWERADGAVITMQVLGQSEKTGPKQFVCAGRHPDRLTEDPQGFYEWFGASPLSVPAADVPKVDLWSGLAAIDAALGLLGWRRLDVKRDIADLPAYDGEITDKMIGIAENAAAGAIAEIAGMAEGSGRGGVAFDLGLRIGIVARSRPDLLDDWLAELPGEVHRDLARGCSASVGQAQEMRAAIVQSELSAAVAAQGGAIGVSSNAVALVGEVLPPEATSGPLDFGRWMVAQAEVPHDFAKRRSLKGSHPAFTDLALAVNWFDHHFYAVQDVGGSLVVIDRATGAVRAAPKFLMAYERHRVVYNKTKSDGKIVEVNESLPKYWLGCTSKLFTRKVFKPYGVNQMPYDVGTTGEVNTFAGFDLTRLPGIERGDVIALMKQHCPTIFEYLWMVSASEREDAFLYDVKWLADVIQNPGRTAGRTAMVHYSRDEGTGKSTFAKLVEGVLGGDKYTFQAGMNAFSNQFTARFEDKLLIACNEFFIASPSMRGVSGADAEKVRSFLFDLIDAGTLEIEHKGLATYQATNCARVVLSSNKTVLLPAGSSGRRFHIRAISTAYRGKSAFWSQLYGVLGFDSAGLPIEPVGGELAAFRTILADIDLTGFSPQKDAPVTEEAKLQRFTTMGTIENQLFEMLKVGSAPVWAAAPDGGIYARQSAVRAAMETALGHPLGQVYNETWFGENVMRKLQADPAARPTKKRGAGSGRDGQPLAVYHWPALPAARKLFEERFMSGTAFDWDEEVAAWVSATPEAGAGVAAGAFKPGPAP